MEIATIGVIGTIIGVIIAYKTYKKKAQVNKTTQINVGTGDNVNGDKVMGDKITGNKIVNNINQKKKKN